MVWWCLYGGEQAWFEWSHWLCPKSTVQCLTSSRLACVLMVWWCLYGGEQAWFEWSHLLCPKSTVQCLTSSRLACVLMVWWCLYGGEQAWFEWSHWLCPKSTVQCLTSSRLACVLMVWWCLYGGEQAWFEWVPLSTLAGVLQDAYRLLCSPSSQTIQPSVMPSSSAVDQAAALVNSTWNTANFFLPLFTWLSDYCPSGHVRYCTCRCFHLYY